jgi:hypothetical protein
MNGISELECTLEWELAAGMRRLNGPKPKWRSIEQTGKLEM